MALKKVFQSSLWEEAKTPMQEDKKQQEPEQWQMWGEEEVMKK